MANNGDQIRAFVNQCDFHTTFIPFDDVQLDLIMLNDMKWSLRRRVSTSSG